MLHTRVGACLSAARETVEAESRHGAADVAREPEQVVPGGLPPFCQAAKGRPPGIRSSSLGSAMRV